MYGLRNKHKVLKYYMEEMAKRPYSEPLIQIPYDTYVKNVKGVPENKVGEYLIALRGDKYLTFNTPHKSIDTVIEITVDGIVAYTSKLLLRKQRELLWTLIKDIALTTANVVVAIAAIIALRGEKAEIQDLKQRVQKLENPIKQLQVPAGPSIQYPHNSYQIKPKDSTVKP